MSKINSNIFNGLDKFFLGKKCFEKELNSKDAQKNSNNPTTQGNIDCK